MAQDTKIEWAHHTVNLWWGCTKVHAGCDNCYAETLSKRFGDDVWGVDKPRKEVKSAFKDLDKYQKLAAKAGEVHRVFVGSMMDIFEKPMPLIDNDGRDLEPKTINAHNGDVTKDWIGTDFLRHKFFVLISNGFYPNLMFLLLTKRPSNINKYIPATWKINPPANVMFGTSPVDQETADKLIPQLLEVKGKKFLSMEPLLGPVDLNKIKIPPYHIIDCIGGITESQVFWEGGGRSTITTEDFGKIDWVIVGGESGGHARPMHPDWVRSLRDQCSEANVPFLFKQWGQWRELRPGQEGPLYTGCQAYIFKNANGTTTEMVKRAKSNTGNKLDGKQYLEFPKH